MSIKETLFGPKRYLTLRKSIATCQIIDKQMYDDTGKKLGTYIQQNGLSHPSGWSVLYFNWDETNQKAEIGISFPVVGINTINDPELTIVDIPQSKASMDILHGSHEGLGGIHRYLMKHVTERRYNTKGIPVMAIDEYVTDPMSDPNPENWETNVYYLHN